ncbi:hypothetical protein LOC54_04990 [Acetobacter sp. AN02]|uniref:hypothetical protein n=1 Tax=Acetobacter sp. AN02 TaxID=2894186 RepID=UPI002434125D|nr:hypothetical protein [Acetobacter sp. AN02]MDG6094474.1 hypothetical protein [Acetobacter sp. AN02]
MGVQMRFAGFRTAVAVVTGFGLVAGQFAAGQAQAAACVSPAREAFAIQKLKSELMVVGLDCQLQDKYNAFVTKFQKYLQDGDTRLNSYFRSTYGRSGQVQHDSYNTELANEQSREGLKSGTIFCMQRTGMFDEVAVLETASDLANYAEAKDILQIASFETCGTSERETGKARASSRRRAARRTSKA